MTPIGDNPFETRADAQRAVRDLIDPLEAHFSPGHARAKPGPNGAVFPDTAAELEGFARPLWGIVPVLAGGGTIPSTDGYRRGLVNGTDPDHPEYWGGFEDCDQKVVEAAAIGVGLAYAPEHLWEPLSPSERERVVGWLERIDDVALPDNNWRWFRILVNAGRRSVGAGWNEAVVTEDLAFVDSCYQGEGWYTDGPGGECGYYVAWAMHLYGLLYADVVGGESDRGIATSGDADPSGDSERFRGRAAAFAPDFVAWFADDGAGVPYGRSLTYRFAQSAFWGALALAGVEAVPWGEIRGLWERNLRWWADQPIGSEGGILQVGYRYPTLRTAEGYNSPSSPYWAMKAFLPLALDAEHPFWSAEESPHPGMDGLDREFPIGVDPGGLVIDRDPETGEALLATAGKNPRRWDGKYEKFAYTTATGFDVPCGDGACNLSRLGLDNTIACSADGDHWRVRHDVDEFEVCDGAVRSTWRPWDDVRVRTTVVPVAPWHVRCHVIDAERSVAMLEGGCAIDRSGDDDPDAYERIEGDGRAAAVYPNGRTRLDALESGAARTGRVLNGVPNTNTAHPRTVVPVLESGELEGRTRVLTVAGLRCEGELPPKPAVTAGGNTLAVTTDRRTIETVTE